MKTKLFSAMAIAALMIISADSARGEDAVDANYETAAHLNSRLKLSADQNVKLNNILAAKEASCKKYTDEDQLRLCILMSRQQADSQIDNLLTGDQRGKFTEIKHARIEKLKSLRTAK